MIKLLILSSIFFSACNAKRNPNTENRIQKLILSDTITDPLYGTSCSLTLRQNPVEVKGSGYVHCTGKALVDVLIDSNSKVKNTEIRRLLIEKGNKILYQISEDVKGEDAEKIKTIKSAIRDAIEQGKVEYNTAKDKGLCKTRILVRMILN